MEPVLFPLIRGDSPLDPPADLRRWRAEAPVRPLTFADGHEGWLITGHAEARAVLSDDRFTTRPERGHPSVPIQAQEGTVSAGFFLHHDPPEHTRYRRLVAGRFTVRRVMALQPRLMEITKTRLDLLENGTRPPPISAGHVEELLRYLTIVHIGIVRTALADLAITGRTIKEGESVAISLPAANRDPARYDHPEELDLARPAAGHLAFGHGIHQCLGQQLARVELRIVLSALFERLPGLRLAVPAGDVPMREGQALYGVRALPITW